MNVDEMTAEELNSAIWDDMQIARGDATPDYAGEIAAAWELVEELTASDYLVTVKRMPKESPFRNDDGSAKLFTPAMCTLNYTKLGTQEEVRRYMRSIWKIGETASLAICRAYLAWKRTTPPRE